jgi:hypothetical protein
VLVAVQTAPGQIRQHRFPAVLPCNDVVGLERQRIVGFRDPAIVAAPLREAAKFSEQLAIHQERLLFLPFCFSDRRAFDFRIPSVWPTRI